ncbi:hypothetical protein RUM43_004823 [Polyplax serrata]|uniref:MARVEL domain-containing protein n=1 Tax=Polyplax serrata TaxID=468196 RepID=A0AAN8SB93_POLSC
MGRRATIGSIVAKVIKIILIMIILILYRVGHNGKFLGVGGTFNLNEEKSADVEILASGVFVGFLVYNLSVLFTYILTGERIINDCIMNTLGTFLWIAVAGTALHYWDNYAKQHEYEVTGNERSSGLALGSLCVFTAAVHFVDTGFSAKLYYDKSK